MYGTNFHILTNPYHCLNYSFTLNVMRGLMISMTKERFDSVYLHFLFVMGTEAPSFVLCLLLLK